MQKSQLYVRLLHYYENINKIPTTQFHTHQDDQKIHWAGMNLVGRAKVCRLLRKGNHEKKIDLKRGGRRKP